MPPLNPADNSSVADDAFDRGRASLRSRVRQITIAPIDRTLTLPIENVSDLLFNGRELLPLGWEAEQLKPADPKSGLTNFGPFIDYLVETVIPVAADRRILVLALAAADDAYGVGHKPTPPETRVPTVLPGLVLYLPASVAISASSTCINDLIPLVEIVFIALIQHDRIGDSLPVGIKPP
ncbi:hypothetical protein OG878_25190 [Streptomyces sp. NBC_00316]|nr:hypothetical protein [Streptomyces sp. NBC_00316]